MLRRYGECAGWYGVESESAPRPHLNMLIFGQTFSTSVAFVLRQFASGCLGLVIYLKSL